ncbi:MAG: TonB-dependent receptor [Bacteroidota bacterium]
MRKSFFILLVLLCGSSIAAGQDVLDKLITLKKNNSTLEEAIYSINDKYEILISFSNSSLPTTKHDFNFRKKRLKDILDEWGEHFKLEYVVLERAIVIRTIRPKRKYTISGYVEDAKSGERLIGAAIFVAGEALGNYSNNYGFYSVTLPEGETVLNFSYIGYQTKEVKLNLQSNQRLSMKLQSNAILPEVVIEGASLTTDIPLPTYESSTEIPIGATNQLPTFAGETDLIRTLHLLPGVQTGADGIGGIYIRGGDPGHNLILIDDVPVYGLSHGAGLLSILNTDAIRSAKLYKGAIPARFGGRLSSVLDIRTKEGNYNQFGGKAEVSLLTAKAFLEGPIVPGKASFFVSGRKSILDWYLAPYSRNFKERRNERGETDYSFNDINVKVNFTLNDNDKVYLSVYRNRDDFYNDGNKTSRFQLIEPSTGQPFNYRFDQEFSESMEWGNTVAALRWNHQFSPKLFGNTTLTYSSMWVDIAYEDRDSLSVVNPNFLLAKSFVRSRYKSSITDVGAKLDMELTPSSNQKVLFGFSYNAHTFEPGATQFNETTDANEYQDGLAFEQLESVEYVAYLENHFSFWSRLNLDLGLRATILSVLNKNYRVLQPRAYVDYELSKNFNIHASYNQTYQFIHLLNNSSIGLPTDLWVPSTNEIAPEESWQTTVGLKWNIRRNWSFQAEAYYKEMDNLITYSDGAYYLSDWKRNITSGRGTSRGFEFQLSKHSGKLTGWASYTLSWTDRQFDQVNNGEVFPFKFDRRHNGSIALLYKASEKLSLSANWTFSTGLAFSLPLQRYDFQFTDLASEPVTALVFNGKNQYRLPPYHRLDVGLNYNFRTDNLKHHVRLGIYNVYNRNNPLYYDLRSGIVNSGGQLRERKEFVQVWLVPFTPSISYGITF